MVYSLWTTELWILSSGASTNGTDKIEFHEIGFQVLVLHHKTPDFIQYQDFAEGQCSSSKCNVLKSHLWKKIGRVENRACISQFLRGPLSSLRHAILHSATHESRCLSLFQLFIIFLPHYKHLLGRDWFLLPCSCWEITLSVPEPFPPPTISFIFFTEYTESCAKFCAWYHGKFKPNCRIHHNTCLGELELQVASQRSL